MRACSCSAVAWAAGGPPHACRSSACTAPCGTPVRWCHAPTSPLSSLRSAGTPGGSPPIRGVGQRRRRRLGRPVCRDAGPPARSAGRAAASPPGRAPATRAGPGSRPPPASPSRRSRRPGRTRRRRRAPGRSVASASSTSKVPLAEPVSVAARLAAPPSRPPARKVALLVARRSRSRAWSRSTSISPACCSSSGTEGRKTDAISPRRRARTKRPTAWAKNSGVAVEVGVDPHASRGTSTPSETIRTATIQRSSDAAKSSMRALAPASSDSTTVGASPVMRRSCAA